jgi:defect-in-organelle-trafficking protein DotD
MKRQLGILSSASLIGVMVVLSGCHRQPPAPPVAIVNHYIIQADLTQAAETASQSMQELAILQKTHDGQGQLPFESIEDPALNQLVSVRWYGPVEQLLRNVAQKIGYQLQVYGKPPKTPILIDIDNSQEPTTAKQVITNADLQAKNDASVLIYVKEKIISLRYMTS